MMHVGTSYIPLGSLLRVFNLTLPYGFSHIPGLPLHMLVNEDTELDRKAWERGPRSLCHMRHWR